MTVLPELVVDRRRAGYPVLRRIISAHLRDVADYVDMDEFDAARTSLQMALAVRSEIEIEIPRRHRT